MSRELLVDVEHALGYPSGLDLAPDRAPLRQFVVAPQRRDAGQPADPARVRRVGGVEAALHQGEPGLAVRAFQLPAVGHAVGEPQGRLAARFELDELGPAGVQLEPAHREAAAHVGLDVHVGAEPPGELLRLGHRVEHRLRCRVDHHFGVQVGRREVALRGQRTTAQVVRQVGDRQGPERLQRATGTGLVGQDVLEARQVGLAQRDQRAALVLGQLELHCGLDSVHGPGEPDGALVHVQHALMRLRAVRRVAAPELVPAGQLHVGVLGQPDTQRGRIGQHLVHGLGRGRNDRAQAQVSLDHRDLPSDSTRPPDGTRRPRNRRSG